MKFRANLIQPHLLFRLVSFSVPFLLPIMLQVSFQYSAEMAGWMLAPLAIGSIFMKALATPILNRFGYKNTLLVASLITGLSTATMGIIHEDNSISFIILAIMSYGMVTSLMFTSINTLCIGDLSQENSGSGATMLSMVQQVGSGIGIAAAAILLSFYRYHLGDSSPELLQNAFSYTFFSTALFCIFLIWSVSRLHQQDGENLRRH